MLNKNTSSQQTTPNKENLDDKSKPAPGGDKHTTQPAKAPAQVEPNPKPNS